MVSQTSILTQPKLLSNRLNNKYDLAADTEELLLLANIY